MLTDKRHVSSCHIPVSLQLGYKAVYEMGQALKSKIIEKMTELNRFYTFSLKQKRWRHQMADGSHSRVYSYY